MEFEEAVRALHSVRDFKSQEIPDEVLTRIAAVGQRTPSWANSQPWKVYIAKGDTLEKIKREHLSKAMQGAPSDIDMQQIPARPGDASRWRTCSAGATGSPRSSVRTAWR